MENNEPAVLFEVAQLFKSHGLMISFFYKGG